MAEAPRELFADPDLPWQAKVAAAVMWSVVSFGDASPTYWETFGQLAARLGSTDRQARRCVELLSASGWIERAEVAGKWVSKLLRQPAVRAGSNQPDPKGQPAVRDPGSPVGGGGGDHQAGSRSLDQAQKSLERAHESSTPIGIYDGAPVQPTSPPAADHLLRDPSVLAQLATYGGQAIGRADLPGPWPRPTPPGGRQLPAMTRPAMLIAERIEAGWTVVDLHEQVHGAAELVASGQLRPEDWTPTHLFGQWTADKLRLRVHGTRERSEALLREPEPQPERDDGERVTEEQLAQIVAGAAPWMRRVLA